jgi:hypothetical protein
MQPITPPPYGLVAPLIPAGSNNISPTKNITLMLLSSTSRSTLNGGDYSVCRLFEPLKGGRAGSFRCWFQTVLRLSA